jgi:hypothetical protein
MNKYRAELGKTQSYSMHCFHVNLSHVMYPSFRNQVLATELWQYVVQRICHHQYSGYGNLKRSLHVFFEQSAEDELIKERSSLSVCKF